MAEFFEHKIGAGKTFNDISGGDIDAFGDMEKKEGKGDQFNMEAKFSAKTLRTIDALGTEAPKGGNKGQKTESGDHFTVGTVEAHGQDGGKAGTGKDIKRS